MDVGEAVGLAELREARVGALLDPVLQLVGIEVERIDRAVKNRVNANVVAIAGELSELHLPTARASNWVSRARSYRARGVPASARARAPP